MAGHTENSIEIKAPMDLVWDMTNDVESWPNLFSEYAEVKIVERKGDTVRFNISMHPDETGKVWSWVSERTSDAKKRTVKAHRVETGPFEYMNIEWYFEDAEGGTRMRWVQDFSMKPEAPADDEQAEQYMNKNTKEQMQVIKERLEAQSAGTS